MSGSQSFRSPGARHFAWCWVARRMGLRVLLTRHDGPFGVPPEQADARRTRTAGTTREWEIKGKLHSIHTAFAKMQPKATVEEPLTAGVRLEMHRGYCIQICIVVPPEGKPSRTVGRIILARKSKYCQWVHPPPFSIFLSKEAHFKPLGCGQIDGAAFCGHYVCVLV